MTFRKKAHYAGPFDDNGIPMLDYRGDIGCQYNPIAIAQYGLGCWNEFQEGGRSIGVSEYGSMGVRGNEERREERGDRQKWKEKALRAADWLVENLEENAKGLHVWMHKFDWEYFRTLKAPWYSGLAQGQGIALLLRVAHETHEKTPGHATPQVCRAGGQARKDRYLDAADEAMAALVTPIAEGGTLFIDEHDDWWIEEYITEPTTHILNGMMWALFGVYDASRVQEKAGKLWEKGILTLEKNLHKYDCGYWSMYDMAPTRLRNLASPFYHKLHLVQLDIMHRLTGKEIFREYHDRWQQYQVSRSCRMRALVEKGLFKLRYF